MPARIAFAVCRMANGLSALGAPAAQAPIWQTFLSELGHGQATLQAMASAALAGARGQLRTLEATAAGAINEPFAYASAHGLGCASD